MVRPAGGCRSCGAALEAARLDLGAQPLATRFPLPADPPEERWPLVVARCGTCGLIQLTDDAPEIDEAGPEGLALLSTTLTAQAERTAAWLTERFALGPGSRVLEASSHGNHLANLLARRGIRAVALEPDAAVADGLRARGIDVLPAGTGDADAILAAGPAADLLIDGFHLAHAADLGAALAGAARVLAPGGALYAQVHDVSTVLAEGHWDAFRHGHFTYQSLTSLEHAAARHGLAVVDAERLPIHGGSIGVVLRHRAAATRVPGAGDGATGRDAAAAIRLVDAQIGGPGALDALHTAMTRSTGALQELLDAARVTGRVVAGYGAPSRAVTLLNAAGIGRERLPRTADASVAKHGRTIPGVRVPIVDRAELVARPPDDLLVLAWTVADEIVASLPELQDHGTRFLVPLPDVQSIPPAHPTLEAR